MDEKKVTEDIVGVDSLCNSEQSKQWSASEKVQGNSSHDSSLTDDNSIKLVNDNAEESTSGRLQELRELEENNATAVVPDISKNSFVNELCPTIEENSTQKDNSIDLEGQTAITDTRNVNMDRDNKELAAHQNVTLMTKPDKNMTTNTANGNLPENLCKLLSSSETEIPIGFEAVLMELGDPGKFFWIQLVIHLLVTFCISNTVLVYVFTGMYVCHAISRSDVYKCHSL